MPLKKVLILYNWFLPAYKAGGPIQSLANLVREANDEYEFFIICSNTEFKEAAPLPNILPNTWVPFENRASVYYLSKSSTGVRTIRKLIKQVNPDIVFANGMYSLPFALYPVCLSGTKTIFSARGMFHPGALSQKPLKKKLFLSAFRLMGLHKKVTFHATDGKEQQYIRQQFGDGVQTGIAGNFPHVQAFSQSPPKKVGSVILGSISLISAMKNHLLVIKALHFCLHKVVYYIYGPVKDHEYWAECQEAMKTLPANITVEYKGEIPPAEINGVMKDFQYFILPSKAENFGHAIFEALTAGKPVITSFFTPWNDLQNERAGFNVNIESVKSISAAIDMSANQPVEEYLEWRHASRNLALNKVDLKVLRNQYRDLFNQVTK